MKLKRIEDYYDQILEHFPDLERDDMEKILKHGFQSFYMLNSRGADVCIKSPKRRMVMYFGKMFNNQELIGTYYNIKWKIKYRLQYKLANKIWNGYYYFGLSKEDYNKYIPKKKGRFKYKIEFKNLVLFKVKEELNLFQHFDYFFKIKWEKEEGFTIKLDKFETRNIELIGKRGTDGKIEWI